ncbi:MAG: hypothetical protein ACR2H3_01555, partial [Acidimicrobiales bacterium]
LRRLHVGRIDVAVLADRRSMSALEVVRDRVGVRSVAAAEGSGVSGASILAEGARIEVGPLRLVVAKLDPRLELSPAGQDTATGR